MVKGQLSDIERTRMTFDQARGKHLRAMEEQTDIPTGEARAIRETAGRGMDEGLAQFTTDQDGGGTFETNTFDAKGSLRPVTIYIEPSSEAALLAGRQSQSDNKRSVRS